MLRRISLATLIYASFFSAIFLLAVIGKNNLNNDVLIANIEAASAQRVSKKPEKNLFTEVSGMPTKINIISRKIELPILPGDYNPVNREWTLTRNSVHFSISSDLASNTAGNTFIYGHNSEHVLGNTKNLQKNDILEITTDNDKIFAYLYSSEMIVDPTDVSVLNYDGETPRLTLMSCTGSWNESRRAMFFDFISVRDI